MTSGLKWEEIAVVIDESAMTYSFCFGIIQVRHVVQYNACYLIYISFASICNICHCALKMNGSPCIRSASSSTDRRFMGKNQVRLQSVLLAIFLEFYKAIDEKILTATYLTPSESQIDVESTSILSIEDIGESFNVEDSLHQQEYQSCELEHVNERRNDIAGSWCSNILNTWKKWLPVNLNLYSCSILLNPDNNNAFHSWCKHPWHEWHGVRTKVMLSHEPILGVHPHLWRAVGKPNEEEDMAQQESQFNVKSNAHVVYEMIPVISENHHVCVKGVKWARDLIASVLLFSRLHSESHFMVYNYFII